MSKNNKICKNCSLYDFKNKICKVNILMEGNKINLPMEPDDNCFFLEETIVKEKGKIVDKFQVEIDQVKIWAEDPKTGEKSDHGIIKIEFPENFFGENKL